MRTFWSVWSVAAVLSLGLVLSGCSFKVEVGYHGQTGTDDRQASALAPQTKAK